MESAAVQDEVRANWVWISLLPLGLGAWAPIYAGVRAQNRRWMAIGAAWSLITVAGWILAGVAEGSAGAGLLIILGWAGAVASSFAIRTAYKEAMSSEFHGALVSAEERLAEHERAKHLAETNPALARELGVGRPDVPDAQAAGLVDVNNAPAGALEKLPGVDDPLATRIVEARAETHGFTSLEDLGMALDLDGDLVEGLRDHVVFLPRVGK